MDVLARRAEVFDYDGDDHVNAYDNCAGVPNPDQADANADGIGDACEGPVADLGLAVTAASDAQAQPGQTLTYYLTAYNVGPDSSEAATGNPTPSVEKIHRSTLGSFRSAPAVAPPAGSLT